MDGFLSRYIEIGADGCMTIVVNVFLRRGCLCRFLVEVIGGIDPCLVGIQNGFDVPARRRVLLGEILLLWLRKERISRTLHEEHHRSQWRLMVDPFDDACLARIQLHDRSDGVDSHDLDELLN